MKRKMIGIVMLAGAALIAAGFFFTLSGSASETEAGDPGSSWESEEASDDAGDGTGQEEAEVSGRTVSEQGAPDPDVSEDGTEQETAADVQEETAAGQETAENAGIDEDPGTDATEKTEPAEEGFHLEGMDEELEALIGGEEGFLDELQKQLYAYGYYDYTSAEILEYSYDGADTVDIDLYVNANMDVDAEMIYSIDEDRWLLKIWN